MQVWRVKLTVSFSFWYLIDQWYYLIFSATMVVFGRNIKYMTMLLLGRLMDEEASQYINIGCPVWIASSSIFNMLCPSMHCAINVLMKWYLQCNPSCIVLYNPCMQFMYVNCYSPQVYHISIFPGKCIRLITSITH